MFPARTLIHPAKEFAGFHLARSRGLWPSPSRHREFFGRHWHPQPRRALWLHSAQRNHAGTRVQSWKPRWLHSSWIPSPQPLPARMPTNQWKSRPLWGLILPVFPPARCFPGTSAAWCLAHLCPHHQSQTPCQAPRRFQGTRCRFCCQSGWGWCQRPCFCLVCCWHCCLPATRAMRLRCSQRGVSTLILQAPPLRFLHCLPACCLPVAVWF
mmetsp:Transcript_89563/g.214049  ORF Transcript_89563/g.214049 Transcript_89563/m.214049 type:complete len:211 (-) Transcript_89563:38-670(-)